MTHCDLTPSLPMTSLVAQTVKGRFACNAGDLGSIPGSERSPGEGNGNTLQYSCLENPMDGEAWQATVHGVAKNQTWLSDFTHSLNSLTLHVSDISSMTGHTNLLYSSPNFEPAYCAMSHYYWLISIQVSQETGNLVFPYLEEFSTVCCDPYSQRLLHSQ